MNRVIIFSATHGIAFFQLLFTVFTVLYLSFYNHRSETWNYSTTKKRLGYPVRLNISEIVLALKLLTAHVENLVQDVSSSKFSPSAIAAWKLSMNYHHSAEYL